MPADNKINTIQPKTTKGVDSLLGNPRKALIRLAIPNSISMLVVFIYQIADNIWVSGLGADALAVMGFVFMILTLTQAVARGLGTGGGTKIAQFIGSKDRELADKTAVHMFIFSVIVSVILILLFLIFLKPLLSFMEAGHLTDTAFKLGLLYISGIFFTIVNQSAVSLLQGEGDAKRAMFGVLLRLILNIILCPVFIYVLKFGVYGAAAGLLTASIAESCLYVYWLFIKKDTYVSCRFKNFRFDKPLSSAIIKLGVPVSLAQVSHTVFIVFALTTIISTGFGTDGVAVYSTGLKFISYIMGPVFGLYIALTTVAAAAIGTGNYEKLRSAYYFTLKIGLIITFVIAAGTFIFAGKITLLFTWSAGSSRITEDLTAFFRIYAWYLPAIAMWSATSTFFIGIGYSIFEFLFNFLKHIFYTIPLTLLLTKAFGFPLHSIWSIIVIGMWVHSFIGFFLLRYYMNRYKETGSFGRRKR